MRQAPRKSLCSHLATWTCSTDISRQKLKASAPRLEGPLLMVSERHKRGRRWAGVDSKFSEQKSKSNGKFECEYFPKSDFSLLYGVQFCRIGFELLLTVNGSGLLRRSGKANWPCPTARRALSRPSKHIDSFKLAPSTLPACSHLQHTLVRRYVFSFLSKPSSSPLAPITTPPAIPLEYLSRRRCSKACTQDTRCC